MLNTTPGYTVAECRAQLDYARRSRERERMAASAERRGVYRRQAARHERRAAALRDACLRALGVA